MGIEIERKFLVTGDQWRTGVAEELYQGYLNTDKAKTVRVRISGEHAYLTIKGQTVGVTRSEFEYAIPLDDARQLMKLCGDTTLEKRRYTLTVNNLVWEVDEFMGLNQGLIVAEVELQSEGQLIDLPDWIGEEVSGDARYYNSSLVENPYTQWGE